MGSVAITLSGWLLTKFTSSFSQHTTIFSALHIDMTIFIVGHVVIITKGHFPAHFQQYIM